MEVSRQTETVGSSENHDHCIAQTPSPPGILAQTPLPRKFWVEVAMGMVSAVLLALTILMPDWFERLFGFTPDAGDGSAEWRLVLSMAAISIVMFGFAGRTWKKHVRILRSA